MNREKHAGKNGSQNNDLKGQAGHSFLLFLTAVIWGSGFVAQSVGMEYIEPFTFTAIRNIIGAVVLLPLVLWQRKNRKDNVDKSKLAVEGMIRSTLIGGVFCGIFLCIASNFQQFGIQYTTVGKAGFLTALYVVIVPVLGLFFRKKVSWIVWASVVLSVLGLYLLCMKQGDFSLQYGDVLELICALMFSFHILIVDHFSQKTDGVMMSAIQFFVCGVLSFVLMLLFENPSVVRILEAWKPILYAGVLASGAGYTLQIVGQKGVNPVLASLILCMESVVSAVAGWLILGQALTRREIFGCILMFAAIVLAQLPVPERRRSVGI